MDKITTAQVHSLLLNLRVTKIPESLDTFVDMLDKCAIERGQGSKVPGNDKTRPSDSFQRVESLHYVLNLLEVGQKEYNEVFDLVSSTSETTWIKAKYPYVPGKFDSFRHDWLARITR